ncbi:hypothetical protein RJT34_11753 [Clitoria ternatea]|uniref:Protein kinase domain-containing protein n=1 Tax=Clitoria ternatea TaxID=43366 RepID=A0AAN9PKS3_CLITE
MSTPPQFDWVSEPSPSFSNQRNTNISNPMHHSMIIWSAIGGFSFLILVSAITFVSFHSRKVVTIKPWSSGLSGQLQKALGTLSSGVEIAVASETRLVKKDGSSIPKQVREAELDWRMRIRIAIGIAYCLEHMHELKPLIIHRNLQSSSIYLTEDYAAEISDPSFWSDIVASRNGLGSRICMERKPLRVVLDPRLNSPQEEIEEWSGVIRNCVHSNPEKRPTMRQVTARLKKVSAMGPDGANPKSSPLWWTEMEIMSSDS